MSRSRQPYFLGYQERWLKDKSRLKLCKKSRRIGWTYVQAYEDVQDAARAEGGMDVWFSSADLSAAKEYIRYCEMWARLLDKGARALGEVVLDAEKDVKALVIEFSNGKRINALSSNPKSFRSKGGKVVLDEFAFHENPDELWKAAAPSILWGFPVRVFSSANGKETRFYRMCQEAQRPDSKWSYHEVNIVDAIDDGLVERIMQLDRTATQTEIDNFLEECKQIAGDDDTFNQEFMCIEVDGATLWIPHALVSSVETKVCPAPIRVSGKDVNGIDAKKYEPDWEFEATGNPYYFGMDIGRHRDLTVIWLMELVGDVLWTRMVLELHQMRFGLQQVHLHKVLDMKFVNGKYVVRRGCIDDGGLGMQLAEEAQDTFGEYRVEAVTFTNAVKSELAVSQKRSLEDRTTRIPDHESVRADFRMIKKTTTPAGNTRFEGERSKDGHADRYWAHALGIHAAGTARGPIEYKAIESGRWSDNDGDLPHADDLVREWRKGRMLV